MDTSTPVITVPCPTCATPIPSWVGPGPACPQCGLPAAGHAGYVVARIEVTLSEFRADRDQLLRSMRALVERPGSAYENAFVTARPDDLDPRAAPADLGPLAPRPERVPVVGRRLEQAPARQVHPATGPGTVREAEQPARRRLSPQQLLLGTGVVLLVSAAIAFVAVAWGSLGLAIQASTLAVLTGSVCAASMAAARRSLPTTGEALAMAGLALIVVDLVAARVKGLAGLDQLPLRVHAVLTLGVVVILGVALQRVAPFTVTWSIGALVAAQPLAFLALPESARTPVPLVATALVVSLANVFLARGLRSHASAVAIGFTGGWWVLGTSTGMVAAWSGSIVESVLCTLLVIAAGSLAVLAVPSTRLNHYAPLMPLLDLTVSAAGAVALAGTLHQAGIAGVLSTMVLGLAVLTCGLLLLPAQSSGALRRWESPTRLAGALLIAISAGQLVDGRNWTELAAMSALAAVCSGAVAILNRALRVPAAVCAAALPAVAVLFLEADGLAPARAGWVVALLAASTLGVACVRVRQMEERPLAITAVLLGLIAVTLTATTSTWGQLALQLVVTGAALLAYGQAAAHRVPTLLGLAELVSAAWVGAAGAAVSTPEVYTLPAVAGLLLVAGRALATAPSWSVWGAPLLVGLLPSTFVALDHPGAPRLVLLVTVATACAVIGTITHRQAPFLIGLGVLVTVAVSELGPYASLLPRWLSLGVAGISLLALGATYERRLAQAREAFGWVSALR